MSSGGLRMPSFGMPKMPSFPKMPNMPRGSMPRSAFPTSASKSLNLPTLMQIVLLTVFSFILGVLLFYLHNKESKVTAIKNSILVVSLMIGAIGVASFLNLNINVYDFLIGSQINILCIYLLLCYIGVTSLFSASTFWNILEYFKDLFGVLINPTTLFSKGFDIIMPTIFLLIPIIVLITNLTKNIFTGLLIIVVSSAVVYSLWPENLKSPPIGGGSQTSVGSTVAGVVDSVRNLF